MKKNELIAILIGAATVVACMALMTNCANTAERETTARQIVVRTNSVLPDPNPALRF